MRLPLILQVSQCFTTGEIVVFWDTTYTRPVANEIWDLRAMDGNWLTASVTSY